MTLQSGGKINMGDINVELKKPRNSRLNLNSSEARTLAKISSGTIKLSDFYGKSTYPAAGTILSYYCSGFDYYSNTADGNGGSYNTLIESNSSNHCGYPVSQNYNYESAGQYSFTLPANVRYLSVSMVGGGGGGGGGDGGYGGNAGGEGTPIQAIIDTSVYGNLENNRTVLVYVGGGGGSGATGVTNSGGGTGGYGYTYGGVGGNTGARGISGGGGGGGGGSAIIINGTLAIFTGGGGGGGGSGLYDYTNVSPWLKYLTGSWWDNGTTPGTHVLVAGQNGFSNIYDGGGAGGGGAGGGYAPICYQVAANGDVYYATIRDPNSAAGYGLSVNWGTSDCAGPGGGMGARHISYLGMVYNPSRFNNITGSGGSGKFNGNSGCVRITSMSQSYREGNLGALHPPYEQLGQYLMDPANAYTPPNNSCFPAGSKVLMGNSEWKAIELVVVGDMVMTVDGPIEIIKMFTPRLGSRKLLRFLNDESFKWSEEHGIWSKYDSKQWWWSANPDLWRHEVSLGVMGGLIDNMTMRGGTQDTEWAHLNGWKTDTIIEISSPSNTMLYLPVTKGKPIIVDGYLVGAGINESLYDYNLIDWDIARLTINETL